MCRTLGLLTLALALDSMLLESLSQDPDLAKVRVSADALDAMLSAQAPLFIRGLVIIKLVSTSPREDCDSARLALL